jgi:hypothetical protein
LVGTAVLIVEKLSIKITPMVDDPDIWRAANLLLKRHSADAEIVAAMRADELLANGDVEGRAVWKQIPAAVTELSRTAPSKGERLN